MTMIIIIIINIENPEYRARAFVLVMSKPDCEILFTTINDKLTGLLADWLSSQFGAVFVVVVV